jgi:hypothetical protein
LITSRDLHVASVLVLGWLTIAAVASGQGFVPLAERIRGSEDVVVAEAQSVTGHWAVNAFGDRLIVSRVLLQVEETLKGNPAESVWMDVEGGTVDGITLRVSSLPSLKPGDRAVFMLRKTESGVYQPHMRGQGILLLDEQNVVRGSNVHMDEIRRLVRQPGR